MSTTTAPEFPVPSAPAAAPAPRPRRWGRWLLGAAGFLLLLGLLGARLLDPWLARRLEKRVLEQTHGQYRLQVGALHTSLWQRAIRLRHLRLRPAAAVADTLPRLRLDVDRLNLTGVGLWALLRRQVVPIDSLVLDSVRLRVLALAQKPASQAALPLHQRLPAHLPGLRLGYLGLRHAQVAYGPAGHALLGSLRGGRLAGHDVLVSAAGAADTRRLGYGAAWQLANVTAPKLADLRVALAQVAATTPPFPAYTTGLGVFPGENPVIYVPVLRSNDLNQLHQRVLDISAPLCRGTDRYNAPARWLPHLSLALHDTTPDLLGPVLRYLNQETYNLRININNLAIMQQQGELFVCEEKFALTGKK